LDAFVFYLVLVRGVGLVVRLAASWFWSGQRPTAHVELALQAVVYIGPASPRWPTCGRPRPGAA
jgi:hypothetical protein